MGEAADAILEGIVCEGCGEYIGESVGYPRNGSCCGGRAGTGINFLDKKEAEKKAKAKRRQEVKGSLFSSTLTDDLNIEELTPYHLRITMDGSKMVLDIYPTNRKFHILKDHDGKEDGERGVFKNIEVFLIEQFSL